ncbi:hypothetical protein EIP86_010727 [Pleurotus ostreatoroseus]|nr:hypothetical protein EIP86_010727 [Pleurotus ostreatoroseus]
MSEAAAHILREAKSLHNDLKELLKHSDVSDREIEITRKNLRRQYLRLLFLHPYARESKDAEALMWMHTSYSLIAIYKQRIASLDRAIQHPRQGQQSSHHPPRTVEYRKLLQRFRQFLAEEEKFWTQLVLRIRRHFDLDDAQSALTALGIAFEDDQASAAMAADGAASPNATRRNQFQFPPELDAGGLEIAPTSSGQRESRIAILSKALVCLGDIARYKEQYNESGGRPRAGHEDGPPAITVGRNGRGRRGGGPASHMALPRLRNYDRAQSCYEQARLLLPHDGNPSHQLAILSSYQKDTFSSLVHYYRALCVRQPYDTASENLGTVLSKTLETYRAKGLQKERDMLADTANGIAPTPRVRVEAFKEKVVVLHALWCMNIDECVSSIPAVSSIYLTGFRAKTLGEMVVKDFADLVGDRILPIDMISKVIILAQGALWKYRMARRPSHGDRRHTRSHATESHIVSHLIATHRVLLKNGSVELAESPPEDAAEHDLAQRITATFRRTLPALRMAGKWLRANTRYISQGRRLAANGDDVSVSATPSRDSGRGGRDKKHHAPPVIVVGLDEFWTEYATFCTSLIRTFPTEELPKLCTQLEEDVEMAGFLPLRKFMMGPDGRVAGIGLSGAVSPRGAGESTIRANVSVDGQQQTAETDSPIPRDQVHPNEEQLMRISDILADAEAIAEDENTPVIAEEGQFVLRDMQGENLMKSPMVDGPNSRTGFTPLVGSHPSLGHASSRASEPEEDLISVTTRTEDDPVREAFERALNDSSLRQFGPDDDEQDEIVYSPPSGLSPRQDPIVSNPITVLPITPPRSRPIGPNTSIGSIGSIGSTPGRLEPISPPRKLDAQQQRSPPAQLTTAEDLLKGFTSYRPQASSQRTPAPPVNLLFGSGALGNSIWSDTADSNPFPHTSPSHHSNAPNGIAYPPQTTQRVAPLPSSQTSPWSPSVPWQTPLSSQSSNTSPAAYIGPSLGAPLNAPLTTSHISSINDHLPLNGTRNGPMDVSLHGIRNGSIDASLNGHFVSQTASFINGNHRRAPSEALPSRTHAYTQPIQPPQRFDPFSYSGQGAMEQMTVPSNGVGVIGRGHTSTMSLSEHMPSTVGSNGFGYTQQQRIESAFYNLPNIGSPSQLGRDRVLSPQYGPTSPPSHIWSNAG